MKYFDLDLDPTIAVILFAVAFLKMSIIQCILFYIYVDYTET